MIFQHTHKQVLNGTKTQTSRLVKPGQEFFMTDMAGGFIGVACKGRSVYEEGKTYAVQPGRGKPAIIYNPDHPCYGIDVIQPGDSRYDLAKSGQWNYAAQGYMQARIRILDISKADVRQYDEGDVKREGFYSFAQFIRVWAKMHDKHSIKYWTSSCSGEYGQSCTRDNAELYTAWKIIFEVVK